MKLRTYAYLASSLMLLCTAWSVQAQGIYRIVGPDGKISFSDRPPASPEQGKITGTGVNASSSAASSDLPYELRQVVSRYPVTLYTGAQCGPCDAGRAMLTARGVPFTERTVSTNEDIAALQRLSGQNALPYLTIGGQRIKGYSDLEWGQYLEAAGYPKTSQLPASYKFPPATPLVAVQKPAEAENKAPEKVEPPVALPPAPAPGGSNPAGIVF